MRFHSVHPTEHDGYLLRCVPTNPEASTKAAKFSHLPGLQETVRSHISPKSEIMFRQVPSGVLAWPEVSPHSHSGSAERTAFAKVPCRQRKPGSALHLRGMRRRCENRRRSLLVFGTITGSMALPLMSCPLGQAESEARHNPSSNLILDRWAKFTGKDPVREDGVKWSELRQSAQ